MFVFLGIFQQVLVFRTKLATHVHGILCLVLHVVKRGMLVQIAEYQYKTAVLTVQRTAKEEDAISTRCKLVYYPPCFCFVLVWFVFLFPHPSVINDSSVPSLIYEHEVQHPCFFVCFFFHHMFFFSK